MRQWIAVVVIVGLAAAPEAAAGDLERALAVVDRAVEEVEISADGQVSKADWDVQRRWAHGLYRWLAIADGTPRWGASVDPEALRDQISGVSPEYAAALVAHPADWLEENAGEMRELRGRGRERDVERFVEAFLVMTPLEAELRRAIDVHEREIARHDATFARREADVELAKELARRGLSKARLRGQAFDADSAYGRRAESLGAAIDRLEDEIGEIRNEFWQFEADWKKQTKSFTYGTRSHSEALAEFQLQAERSNDQVMALTDELTELVRKRANLDETGSLEALTGLPLPPGLSQTAAAAAKTRRPKPRPTADSSSAKKKTRSGTVDYE